MINEAESSRSPPVRPFFRHYRAIASQQLDVQLAMPRATGSSCCCRGNQHLPHAQATKEKARHLQRAIQNGVASKSQHTFILTFVTPKNKTATTSSRPFLFKFAIGLRLPVASSLICILHTVMALNSLAMAHLFNASKRYLGFQDRKPSIL